MNELSLFTGAGGGLLGTHHLLEWRTIGMVEIDDYCQRVLRQRQDDGFLDECPIFGDIRAFISEGYAESYRGLVDVITAGFPCQPFSVAGKRLGADDPRNMWPETIAVIRAVRPRFCLLENTPGLLSGGYFGTVLGGLAESGYDCRWRVLSAAEVGAPHLRDRVWIVAHTRHRSSMVDAQFRERKKKESGNRGAEKSYGNEHLLGCANTQRSRGKRCGIWSAHQPSMGRVANGMAYQVDRLKATGNGQVPAVVATAWQLLTGGTRQ